MEKIIVFGAGEICDRYLCEDRFHNFEILCITDNDEKKWGTERNGIKVIEPSKALKDTEVYDKILILSSAIDEIKHQLLKEYKVDKQKIISYKELVYFPLDCNTGDIVFSDNFMRDNYVDMDYLIRKHCISTANDLEHFYFYGKHKLIHKGFHYFEIYHHFFEKFRGRKINVLEIGVSKGGSLQMWKHYFGADAQIVGIDIDEKCLEHKEDNIDILIGSQADENFLRQVIDKYGEFDIIIDDGSHIMSHQIIAFEQLFSSVRQGGVYLCEDTCTSYWEKWGGGYRREDTFMEYSKKLIDDLHRAHIREDEYLENVHAGEFSELHFYDSVVVVEKKKGGTPVFVRIENP